jgi:sugar phosphate isomerase/epimerase
VAFARRAAERIVHVHLKDYRAAFTDEGFTLVRCAIGEGAVPLAELLKVLDDDRRELTASIEPAALEARHIRVFAPEWWHGYPPRDAAELGTLLGRLSRHQIPVGDDYRTPWEIRASPEEIITYEYEHVRRSVDHVRALVNSR